MDLIPDPDVLSSWLIQYGGIALFCLLCVGIVALPVPEETLMVAAGVLMRHGKLEILPTFIAAILGSTSGITVSYMLGRLAGNYLLSKYGKWIGLTQKRRDRVHKWFNKFGKWALLVGYFIPGVRHFTGFIAGSSNLAMQQFALYAYSGAFVWVCIFLSLGYFSGAYWLPFYERIEPYLDFYTVVGCIAALIVILYLLKKVHGRKS